MSVHDSVVNVRLLFPSITNITLQIDALPGYALIALEE
jgi:hypothetical protein